MINRNNKLFKYKNSVIMLMLLCITLVSNITATYAAPTGQNYANDFSYFIDKIEADGSDIGFTSDGITENFEKLTEVISDISFMVRIVAWSLAAVAIAYNGIRIMNTRGPSEALKLREDFKQLILSTMLIVAMPIITSSVANFKMPDFSGPNSIDKSSLNYIVTVKPGSDNPTIEKLAIMPNSNLTNEFDALMKEGEISNPGPNYGDFTTEESSGILALVLQAILYVIVYIVYSPLKYLVTLLGVIAMYPVSLDATVYDVKYIDYFLKESLGTIDFFSEAIPTPDKYNPIAMALSSATIKFTNVINYIFYISKKISFACLEITCYLYAVMSFIGTTKETVVAFLARYFRAILGMVLIPVVLQFLLDIDAIFSTAIIGMAGSTGLPGISLLSLIPPVSVATESFIFIFIGALVMCMVLSMSLVFIVRRIEIVMYYMAGPFICLGHVLPINKDSLPKWFSNVSNAIFLPTIYSPLFVTIAILLGTMNIPVSNGTEVTALVIYYLLVFALMYFGKLMIPTIMGLFGAAMSSHSNLYASSKVIKFDPIGKVTNAAKNVAGLAVAAATGGATAAALLTKTAQQTATNSGSFLEKTQNGLQKAKTMHKKGFGDPKDPNNPGNPTGPNNPGNSNNTGNNQTDTNSENTNGGFKGNQTTNNDKTSKMQIAKNLGAMAMGATIVKAKSGADNIKSKISAPIRNTKANFNYGYNESKLNRTSEGRELLQQIDQTPILKEKLKEKAVNAGEFVAYGKATQNIDARKESLNSSLNYLNKTKEVGFIDNSGNAFYNNISTTDKEVHKIALDGQLQVNTIHQETIKVKQEYDKHVSSGNIIEAQKNEKKLLELTQQANNIKKHVETTIVSNSIAGDTVSKQERQNAYSTLRKIDTSHNKEKSKISGLLTSLNDDIKITTENNIAKTHNSNSKGTDK